MLYLLNEFKEYIPFNNQFEGNQAKACLVKGWNSTDCNNARSTIEDCPKNSWIQRRCRIRDNSGNYLYNGLIIVDVDDKHWSENVLNRIKCEKLKCQARQTKNGYHFIFAFDPDSLNASTCDYMLALGTNTIIESTHNRTSYISDFVVDYKFTEIVRHIENINGNYVGMIKTSDDHVVNREIVYTNLYSEAEQKDRNCKEQLPKWFPPYDFIPDWLIPINATKKIEENELFDKEIEAMASLSDLYLCDDGKRVDIPAFIQALNASVPYKTVRIRSNRKLMIYKDGYYHFIDDTEFVGFIDTVLSVVGYGHTKDCTDISSNIYKQLMRKTNLSYLCNIDDLDADENIINFENGILNISTGEMLAHSPKYLSTIQIPCKWDPNAPEPVVFINYLRKLTDGLQDQDQVISLILQYCGACIANVPVYKTKAALIFNGKSNAGKSQIFNLMFNLLGKENTVPIDLKNISENRFAKISLFKKRLVGNAELQHSSIIESGNVFKNLSSGDYIDAEEKFKDIFSFKYDGGLMFCCNECPAFKDNDDGLLNRLFIINCNNEIPVTDRDPELQEKFKNEYSGIIKLMLSELYKLKSNNWTLYSGGSISLARQQYREKTDNLSDFLDLAISDDCSNGTRSMLWWYEAYIAYNRTYSCNKGQIIDGKLKFLSRLVEATKCDKKKSNNVRYLSGIYPTAQIEAIRSRYFN